MTPGLLTDKTETMGRSAKLLDSAPPEAREPTAPPSDLLEVVVIDDEPLSRRRLTRLLGKAPDVTVTRECGDGEEAVAALRELRPDVAFVDIKMPGRDGFQVLLSIEAPELMVVFVTAYAEYAVDAFDARALDYLLKPVEPGRLAETLDRIRERWRCRNATDRKDDRPEEIQALSEERAALREAIAELGDRFPERLLLKDGSKATFLSTEEISWIEADGNYVQIHATDRTHMVRRSIGELERTLDPIRFVRIHRSTIVNLNRVKSLSPAFAGAYYVHLVDGTELTLSRGYRDKLFDRIGKSL